jgi:hypothetical protein
MNGELTLEVAEEIVVARNRIVAETVIRRTRFISI